MFLRAGTIVSYLWIQSSPGLLMQGFCARNKAYQTRSRLAVKVSVTRASGCAIALIPDDTAIAWEWIMLQSAPPKTVSTQTPSPLVIDNIQRPLCPCGHTCKRQRMIDEKQQKNIANGRASFQSAWGPRRARARKVQKAPSASKIPCNPSAGCRPCAHDALQTGTSAGQARVETACRDGIIVGMVCGLDLQLTTPR